MLVLACISSVVKIMVSVGSNIAQTNFCELLMQSDLGNSQRCQIEFKGG